VPLETRGAVAAFDPATGRVTLSASTQMPHLLRTGIADVLGIPEAELRVIAPEVGGGFGQKMPLIPEYVVAVWAARRFAWIEDRLENLTASFHARDQRLHMRAAFDANGRLLAIDADVLCNVVAYSNFPATCGVEPLMALADMPGPYQVSEYRARARGVASNTCPMAPIAAYRGPSSPRRWSG
jgi:aerobic carbon-monoxide dehydrogenase large subunit